MTAEEYLSEVRIMKMTLDRKKEQYRECIDRATSITIPMKQVKVQSSKSGNGNVEKYMTAAVDLERKIEQAELEFFDHRHMLTRQIQGLAYINARYVQVLYEMYINFKGTAETAIKINMSHSYVRKLHKDALAAFEKRYAGEIAEWERSHSNVENGEI